MSSNDPRMGVRAEVDDSQAKAAWAAYLRRMKAVENAIDKFTNETKRNNERRAQSEERASKRQIQALITLRRQLITVMFFLRFFAQAVRAAWNEIVEASETRALIAGVQALASAYGQNLGQIQNAMSETAGSLVGDANNIRAAQAGLLADHGRFVENYDELWQAARVAAVTAGGDAIKIFQQLVSALNEADAAAIDSASAIFNVEIALIQYAVASGRTTDQLTEQEKRQVILNETMRTTNALLEAGAQEALDATKPVEELRKGWDLLTGTLSGVAVELMHFIEIGEHAQGVTDALGYSMAVYVGTIFAAVEALNTLSKAMTFQLQPDDITGFIDRIVAAAQAGFELVHQQFFTLKGGMAEEGGKPSISIIPPDKDLEDELRRYEEFLKKVATLRERYTKEMESLEIRLTQRMEELEITRQQRLEEIQIKAHRKREELLIQLHRRLDDADREYYRALERMEQQNALKRERIWQRYWEEVRRINRKFMEDIYDAIAARDATAALKAIRRRRADLEDAAHDRDLSLHNLRQDNELELEELRRKREEAREDARRAYAEGLEDLARWIKEEQDDLARHLAYQRAQIENWHKWRLQAIAEQYRLEYLQAYAAYTGQEELLADHVARMNAIWAQMISALNIPPIPPPPGTGTGGVTGQQEFARGGVNVFNKRTNIVVGEGPVPEVVVAIPLGGQAPAPVPMQSVNVNHLVSGEHTQRIRAELDRGFAGFEGRMQAAFLDALGRVL